MYPNKKARKFFQGLQVTAILVLGGFSQSLLADWQLNPERSTVYFASIKSDTAVEVHRFPALSGQISSAGDAHLEIDLAGVNTNIEIRDNRMKEHLFKVDQFPKAHISVSLGDQGIQDGIQDIKALLNLHGHEQELDASVNVVLDVDNNALKVMTAKPLVLKAGDFGLLEGIEALREMAALPSIAPIVPVSFLLYFEEVEAEGATAEMAETEGVSEEMMESGESEASAEQEEMTEDADGMEESTESEEMKEESEGNEARDDSGEGGEMGGDSHDHDSEEKGDDENGNMNESDNTENETEEKQ